MRWLALALLLWTNPVWAATGSARTFNGTTDYATLGNPAALKYTSNSSWACWTAASSVDTKLLSKQGGALDRGWTLNHDITASDGAPYILVADTAISMVSAQGTASIVSNQVYHFAGTYEPSVALKTYVNGVLDANNTTAIPASQVDSTQNVNIGRQPSGFGYTAGDISYCVSVNRTFTIVEVNEIMWYPLQMPNVDGMWPLFGTESPEIDLSGNGLTATLNGTSTSATGPPVMVGAGPY